MSEDVNPMIAVPVVGETLNANTWPEGDQNGIELGDALPTRVMPEASLWAVDATVPWPLDPKTVSDTPRAASHPIIMIRFTDFSPLVFFPDSQANRCAGL